MEFSGGSAYSLPEQKQRRSKARADKPKTTPRDKLFQLQQQQKPEPPRPPTARDGLFNPALAAHGSTRNSRDELLNPSELFSGLKKPGFGPALEDLDLAAGDEEIPEYPYATRDKDGNPLPGIKNKIKQWRQEYAANRRLELLQEIARVTNTLLPAGSLEKEANGPRPSVLAGLLLESLIKAWNSAAKKFNMAQVDERSFVDEIKRGPDFMAAARDALQSLEERAGELGYTPVTSTELFFRVTGFDRVWAADLFVLLASLIARELIDMRVKVSEEEPAPKEPYVEFKYFAFDGSRSNAVMLVKVTGAMLTHDDVIAWPIWDHAAAAFVCEEANRAFNPEEIGIYPADFSEREKENSIFNFNLSVRPDNSTWTWGELAEILDVLRPGERWSALEWYDNFPKNHGDALRPWHATDWDYPEDTRKAWAQWEEAQREEQAREQAQAQGDEFEQEQEQEY